MNNNIFYLLKGEQQTATSGQYNTSTGEFESATSVGQYCVTSWLTDLRPSNRKQIPLCTLFPPDINVKQMRIFFYDKDNKYLSYVIFSGGDLDEYHAINDDIRFNAEYVKCDFVIDISETELSQMTQSEIDSLSLIHI